MTLTGSDYKSAFGWAFNLLALASFLYFVLTF